MSSRSTLDLAQLAITSKLHKVDGLRIAKFEPTISTWQGPSSEFILWNSFSPLDLQLELIFTSPSDE